MADQLALNLGSGCSINYALWWCSTHNTELTEEGKCPKASGGKPRKPRAHRAAPTKSAVPTPPIPLYKFSPIRVGKIDPRYLHISDVDRIIGPHGDGAQEAFDRDLGMALDSDPYDD